MPERFCRLTAMFLRRSLAEGLASRHSNIDRRVQAVIECLHADLRTRVSVADLACSVKYVSRTLVSSF